MSPAAALVLEALRSPEVRDELASIVAEAIPAPGRETAPPRLVDRRTCAEALGISLAALDRLRAEGMPSVRIGDAPRFDVQRVIAWLGSRGEPLRLAR